MLGTILLIVLIWFWSGRCRPGRTAAAGVTTRAVVSDWCSSSSWSCCWWDAY